MRALFCKVIFTWNFTLNHMEFNVKWNGSGWHIQWLSTSQITWSCSESIKIWNNYYKNTFWPQTRQIFSRGISHWITWNSMWNEMVSDGLMAHTVGLHIIEYFNLSGNHKNSKQLSWEHFFVANPKMCSRGIPCEMKMCPNIHIPWSGVTENIRNQFS